MNVDSRFYELDATYIDTDPDEEDPFATASGLESCADSILGSVHIPDTQNKKVVEHIPDVQVVTIAAKNAFVNESVNKFTDGSGDESDDKFTDESGDESGDKFMDESEDEPITRNRKKLVSKRTVTTLKRSRDSEDDEDDEEVAAPLTRKVRRTVVHKVTDHEYVVSTPNYTSIPRSREQRMAVLSAHKFARGTHQFLVFRPNGVKKYTRGLLATIAKELDINSGLTLTPDAMACIHELAEAYMVRQFRVAQAAAAHAKRVTLCNRDVHFMVGVLSALSNESSE